VAPEELEKLRRDATELPMKERVSQAVLDRGGGFIPLTIREYRDEDFHRICEIDGICFPTGIAYSTEEMKSFVRSRRSITLVAEDKGLLVGFVIAAVEPGRFGHIITIDVLPAFQSKGIGSSLLAEVEGRLARQGVLAIYLETAVDNSPAIRFYEKHGYVVIRRLKGYYLQKLDAFLMMKNLLQA